MATIKLNTPFDKKDIQNLKVGDTVYISGKMFTARDECHLKMLELHKEGKDIPFKPEDMALFHCGPVVQKKNDEWRIVSAGPTTSIRMEIFEDEFLKTFKCRMIIGKGGMADRTLKALEEVGAVYVHYTGGAGALAAMAIKKVEDVYWLDELGIPEAAWILDVCEFGPLTVTIDAHGNSLYNELGKEIQKNLEKIHREIEK
ncbi:fumarate hydratase C-terminal domain-containing protein [candidate division WOR-3 bacterium]|nr:fumarate hydratase C-terminal domain-containing protein [candidate division WOR-3 bacterium]